jgi:hypothetical protein
LHEKNCFVYCFAKGNRGLNERVAGGRRLYDCFECICRHLAAAPLVNLDQNWSGKDIKTWYDATQGSRLMPLDWFLALEQPDSSSRFLADEHIAKFGYLPRPGQLPVGFARDDTPADQLAMTALRWKSAQKANENWIGLNCAACHTAKLPIEVLVCASRAAPLSPISKA